MTDSTPQMDGSAKDRRRLQLIETYHQEGLEPPPDLVDGAAGGGVSQGAANLRAISAIRPEQVKWLWSQRIPRGKLVVLDGDPGLGKSTLTLDFAARVSAGEAMPDQSRRRRPAGVVILSAEDGPADTIRPRLEAAGADLDQVFVLDTVATPEGDHYFAIPDDIPTLERSVQERKAALVVIDPLTA